MRDAVPPPRAVPSRNKPGFAPCKGCKQLYPHAQMSVIESGGRRGRIERCPDCTWAYLRSLGIRQPDSSDLNDQPDQLDLTVDNRQTKGTQTNDGQTN